MIYDVIIVGAGVAGLTAALYARRSGKTVLLLEEETIGGQAALSPKVENIPSIESIAGSDFTDSLFTQVLNLGAEIELEKVEWIAKEVIFAVHTNYSTYTGKSVILANGVKHKHLNLENEDEMIGNGISYCAVCDGAFYKGEEVALVGDANTALQYALLLSNICPKVYMYTLFDKFFGDDVLVQALKKKDNIIVVPNVSVVGYEKVDGQLSAVKYKNSNGDILTQPVKALFIAIGQVADNKRFNNIVDLTEDGFIIGDENMCTKTEGVFVAGDCRNKKIRQITTACSDGAIAALSATTYIEKL